MTRMSSRASLRSESPLAMAGSCVLRSTVAPATDRKPVTHAYPTGFSLRANQIRPEVGPD
jgi:hypothetical protein